MVAKGAGLFVVPLAVYALILALRITMPLRPVSIAARYSFALVFPLVAGLVYLSYRIPGYWGRLISLTLALALFGLATAGFWASVQSEDQALSGLLPWNDSTAYYVDGLNWLDGLRFGTIAARRPLLPLMFSALLGLAGRNLQAAVALLSLLMGVSVYLAAREVQRTHGAAPAALAFVVLFFFARRYTATITTEALGIILGSLGFALLWRSASMQRRRLPNVLLGLFFLTVGSMARPAALFVLPLAALWAARSFRKRGWLAWDYAALGSAVVAGGILVNQLMFGLSARPDVLPFSNFPYLFYGMAYGGIGWDKFKVEHGEEVRQLSEAEKPQLAMRLALEEVRAHPQNLVRGTLKQYGLLVSDTYYSLYSFITYDSALRKPLHFSLYGLCLLGLLAWALNRKDPYSSLIGAGVVGTLLSVPFAPPMDANRMRVYAATIPVLALLPALGLAFVLSRLKVQKLLGEPREVLSQPVTAAFGVLVLILTLAAPLIAPALTPNTTYGPVNCAAGQRDVYLRYGPGTAVNIHRESDFFLDWLPDIHAGRFRDFLHNTGNLSSIRIFESIEPPTTLLVGPDLKTGEQVWLAVDGAIMPQGWGVLAVCGKWAPDKDGTDSILFQAKSVELQ